MKDGGAGTRPGGPDIARRPVVAALWRHELYAMVDWAPRGDAELVRRLSEARTSVVFVVEDPAEPTPRTD